MKLEDVKQPIDDFFDNISAEKLFEISDLKYGFSENKILMKLETKDLMIGNILDFNGMECVVKEIDELGVVVSIEETSEEEWIDIFQFSPVPITEDWLIKLGFNNGDWSDDKYDVEDDFADSFTYTLQSNVFHRPLWCMPIYGWQVYLGENKEKVCFHYLHEVQNIINTLNINNGKSK